jgi:hypothetical protein
MERGKYCTMLYQNNVNKIKCINNCILINKEINVFGGKLGKGSVNLEPPRNFVSNKLHKGKFIPGSYWRYLFITTRVEIHPPKIFCI